MIGTEAAAKSPADGYVIYVGGSVSMVVSPAMYAKAGYDAVRDFVPVSLVSQFYNVASVHPSLPVKNVKELTALAKARPGDLLMGSAGNGSTSHLAGALFNSMSNTRMLHVPYKSGGQLVIAVVSGEAHLSFSPVSTAIGQAAAGKLRMLGVSSPKRLPNLPDLPAIAETLPGYEFGGWQGIFVPAGTPPDTVRRLNAATLKAANVDIITASPQFVAEMKKKIQPVEDEWIKEAKSRGWDGARFLGELRAEVKKLAAAK